MRSVGIKVLKNRLSEFVRAAEAGETVLITDRHRVVAELGPPHLRSSGERPLSDAEFTAMGVREGWLTPAARTGPLPAPIGLPVVPLERLLEELDGDREDR